MAPENGWLEYEFPFGMAYFQGRTVSFREGRVFQLGDSTNYLTQVWLGPWYHLNEETFSSFPGRN